MEHTFSVLLSNFRDPFPAGWVRWIVVEVREERAFVTPYVEAAHYKVRLDEMTPGWKMTIDNLETGGVCYRLEIPGGDHKHTGGADLTGPNTGLGKEFLGDRAFIRTCQEFGLGEYLEYLPGLWVDYDPKAKKVISAPPVLPAWALPGGAGFPANVPGKPQPALKANEKKVQKPAHSPQTTKSAPEPGKNSESEKVQESAPSPQTQSATVKDSAACQKQEPDEIANAQALKAWGDLVMKAKKAGITDIESIVPPIKVRDLRTRYRELKDRMDQISAKGDGK